MIINIFKWRKVLCLQTKIIIRKKPNFLQLDMLVVFVKKNNYRYARIYHFFSPCSENVYDSILHVAHFLVEFIGNLMFITVVFHVFEKHYTKTPLWSGEKGDVKMVY